MTATIEPTQLGDEPQFARPSSPGERRARPLLVAAGASLSAGAIHAAAVGAHAEHPRAAEMFIAVAVFQIGWGALALMRSGRLVALIGAAGNALLFGGWVLAKWKGISFIDGLNEVEPIQFADILCAILAAVAAGAAAAHLLGAKTGFRLQRSQPLLVGAAMAIVLASAVPGMVEAGKHHHEGSGTTVVVENGKTKVVTVTAAVPAKPYDPAKPIDLGGVSGVSQTQQARAENLVAETVNRLPQWSDAAKAEKVGFHSINDGGTGYEHLINWSYIGDDKTLDPDHPEALVYRVEDGKRTLESAMFMLAPGADLNHVPDLGGSLTQWHIHDNLCFTNDPVAPHVAGLTAPGGECHAPLVKLQPVPMIHVWIVPRACGPFAALEGVGAGQVKPGETANCDHVHGSGL